MAHLALDPFAFFIIAIILFNVVSAIVKGIRSSSARVRSIDVQAKARLSQALQQGTAAADLAAARRAQEIARLRKALLASAGLADADADATQTAQTVAAQPTLYQRVPVASTVTNAPPGRVVGLAQRPLQVSPSAPVTTPAAWSLQNPGTLMSLESASTAFQQLATPGSAAATAQSAAAAAAAQAPVLTLLQDPDSAKNLFIAAAIVGPCAAFRSLGHTPGGW